MFLIPLMAFLCRAAGASWNPYRQWAEICFAAAFAFAGARYGFAPAFIAWVWTYLVFQTGHGRFYEMNGANLNDPNPEKLELVVQKFYKGDITKPIYSWICMGLKGLLIGLAAFPYGLLLAFLWPLAYYLGFRVIKRDGWNEYLAGACAGLTLALVL